MQGLVRPNLEELFPCLKPRITSWPAGNRGQLKAAALGSYTTSRTLKELSLIRRKPVCTLKEVCETCMSLLVVVQLVSHVWLFATLRVNCIMPGLSVHHCLPEFAQTMSIELVMPSNHLILCRPLFLLRLVFLTISFPMSQLIGIWEIKNNILTGGVHITSWSSNYFPLLPGYWFVCLLFLLEKEEKYIVFLVFYSTGSLRDAQKCWL